MSDVESNGVLIVIGGHEEKKGERIILRELARRLKGGRLVIATIASHQPEGYFESYREGFQDLGLESLTEVYVEDRAQALDPEKLSAFDNAAGVFFTGGDQLRITSQIGSTPLEQRIRDIYARGGVIAGTSAGAAVMPETMLVKGSSWSPIALAICSWRRGWACCAASSSTSISPSAAASVG